MKSPFPLFPPVQAFPFFKISKKFSAPTCPPLNTTSQPSTSGWFVCARHNGAPGVNGAIIYSDWMPIANAA